MPYYQFAQFCFDVNKGSLINHQQIGTEQEIQLRHKVANLLAYLIENRDRIVSKEELLNELWQHGDYRENSLIQSIRELRLALGDKAKDATFVKTYPQRGYQWICEIEDTDNKPEHIQADYETQKIAVTDPDKKYKAPLMNYYFIILFVLMFIALSYWFIFNKTDYFQQTESKQYRAIESVLVLPFINDTEQSNMAWLELGLADMLAIDIQRHIQLKVTPPAIANALMLDAQMQWPSLPVHIRSLLKEHQIHVALFASVRLHNKQQVLDFQLIYADGKTKQGSISYPSLPSAAQSITQQLLYLLLPDEKNRLPIKDENPIAALALVEGMQALQKEGPLKAQKYFKASLTLNETSHWTRAYLARSLYSLGDWQRAESLFDEISNEILIKDPSLDAFVQYWRAELAFRRGDKNVSERIDIALNKAEIAVDTQQMALSYRLKAKIAWDKMQWSEYKIWSTKAKRLFGNKNALNIEAQKQFYLGNPSNIGLEKSPDIDLKLNQVRLLKALNFYQQLGDLSMVAASQLAIAQNYTFELEIREKALKQALSLYEKLEHPYELALTLVYAGFYHMQLHDGLTASQYFYKAKNIAVKIGAKPLIINIDFYLAFANLDLGLDQSTIGGHDKNEAKLLESIKQFEHFIAKSPSEVLKANALVFLGWANTDLGNFDIALEQLKQAKKLNVKLKMPTSFGYSSYSIMRIHLERQDYDSVTNMLDDTITTRLQANFLARAFYEKGQVQQAINVLNDFKHKLPQLWQPDDTQRLGLYENAITGDKPILLPEPKAHLVYCESDWIQ
ncbi:winged helix-turn-helix domain-containing protein [Pseudoalteromonas denitrificans]|uniref:DNA-binding winged helix-turn-helix (WHTH) domain-containing protein n=1 Tax=Pseudoalteromonas denitrificans DSM 6059 TaxID=1123010 RepID=A0A1I1M445_9GAMM|nr:winged helix-turn-helix domain-containing protein [Pseudoalteromonas denitrificans]SFC79826.1 DNA-binding winged helix-turn-helix (wHTH) domain-containing protein [Pseudoalteromonas denitrificans DSM 6059]